MNDRIEIKAALSVSDAGEITGTAWPYGTPDRVGDVIEKGAFTSPATLPMLWAHDQSQVVGVWDEITETDTGLTVKGRLLVDDVARAREVRAMIQAKAVTGLSIGFQTTKATPRGKGRTITGLNLHEISVVAVPCHPGAQITSLKSEENHTPMKEMNMENQELAPGQNDETKAADAAKIEAKRFDDMKARLDALEVKAARPGFTAAAPALHTGDEQKAFGDYLRTGNAAEVKALAYGNGAGNGAVLAPETVAKTILERIAEFSPVRNVAQVIQMGGPLLQLPRLVTDVIVGDVAEGAAKPESEPTFEQIDIKPFEMGVVIPVTKTLLEDAHIDLSGYLAGHIARRFGQKEAAQFVNGNGVTQAEGVLGSPDVQEVETTALTSDALMDQFYSIKTAYSATGTWMMNRSTMSAVSKMKGLDGAYLWQPSLALGAPATLLGRPVLEAADMPNVGTGNSPIIFGDFYSGYAVADRIGFEIIRDELTGAASGMVKFVARRRVGGRVIMGEALSKMTTTA